MNYKSEKRRIGESARKSVVAVSPFHRFTDSPIRLWRLVKHHKAMALGGGGLLLFVFVALCAPLLAPHDPLATDLSHRLQPPAWWGGDGRYWLGCDPLGRDLFSRILYGARVSLFVGVVVVALSAAVGTLLGLLAGYFGGRLDAVLSGIAEILLAFPLLIFAIGLMAATGPGLLNLVLALSYKGWVSFFRLVRGDTLSAKEAGYVEAAVALGVGPGRILWRHILPNVLPPVIALAALTMATVILMEASLSFLGLGVQPPTPTWGAMVNDGRAHLLNAWWVSTFAGAAIFLLALSVNLLGQGLRDALDPRLS